jgi:integrase
LTRTAETPGGRRADPEEAEAASGGPAGGDDPEGHAKLTERASKYANTREKTLARYLVLTTTLQRPIQVMRAKPSDIDLANRWWLVRGAKGNPRIRSI